MDKDVVTVNGQEVDTEGLTIIQKLKDRNGKAPVYFKTKHNETYTEFYDYSDAPFWASYEHWGFVVHIQEFG